MLRSTIILLVSVCFIASGHSAPADAPAAKKQKAPSASPWLVKTYRFYDLMDIETKTHGRLIAPKPPDAKAPEKDVTEFIKKSHLVLNAYFGQTGYAPPQGSLFVFDQKTSTLVARTTESYHTLISIIERKLAQNRTYVLGCSLEIFEAEAPVMREEVKSMTARGDHTAALNHLSAMADQGKAKRISSGSIQTRSGQRVKISTATGHHFSTGYTIEENGSYKTDLDRFDVGTILELDPVLGEDHDTIDVNFALTHDFANPTERWARSSARIANQAVESQVTDFHNVKLNSAITMLSGQARLLGIWKPETTGNAAPQADLLQAAFLSIDATQVSPLENEQLQPWLTTIGEKFLPTPKDAPPEPEGIPKGMKMQLFKMSPEFLGGMPSASAAADPFSAGPAANTTAGGATAIPQSAATEARFTTKSTAMEILRSLGATFPPGSSATYDERNGILLVRNTPENLNYLDAMTSDLRKSISKTFALTAHIIQADGATIRKLQQDSRRIADHSNVWQSVEETIGKQQASIVRSAWIATRSGQRAFAEFGHEIADVNASLSHRIDDSSSSPKTDSSAEPNPKPGETKQPPVSSPVANASVKTASAPSLDGSHDAERVGTRLEIDPVLGEDGITIDLNLALTYDYAMPTETTSVEQPAAKTLRPEVNGHDFHRVDVNQVTTMETGTWRLISVWKPHGTAEFDGKDILQALFIKADIVEVKPEE